MKSTSRSFRSSFLNSAFAPTRRSTLLRAAALIAAIGASGCAVSAGDSDETIDDQEEALSLGELSKSATALAGPVGATAGVVSAAISVAKLLGFSGNAYAQLSDATIKQIAAAVGQQVDASLLQKDSADASALLLNVGFYTRDNCTNCSQDLQVAKQYGHDFMIDSSKLLYRMTDSAIGNKQLQVAQHIQVMGSTLVLFSQEAYTIQKLLGTSPGTLPTLRQNICDAAKLVRTKLDGLEVVYNARIPTLFSGISLTSSGNPKAGTVTACFTGPYGKVCKSSSYSVYGGTNKSKSAARTAATTLATNAKNQQITQKNVDDRPAILGASFNATRNKMIGAGNACN